LFRDEIEISGLSLREHRRSKLKSRRSLTQSGFAIGQALVACAIFAIVSVGALQIAAFYRTTVSREKLTDSTLQTLMSSMQRLRQEEFTDLVNYCVAKNLLGTTSRVGDCLSDGRIRSTPSTDAKDIKYGLLRPTDARGDDAAGTTVRTCIEVTLCRPRADGRIIDIHMNQYTYQPGGNPAAPRSRVFRRSKW
jgi:type II secretory pathway pseudopilin PulG